MSSNEPCGHAALYRPTQDQLQRMGDAEDQCRSVSVGGAMVEAEVISRLREELDEANRLLGDAAFFIRRLSKIVEGYNHPSGIHRRAMEWVQTKWKGVNNFVRWDREGRDVTALPGLWSADDCEISATNFAHPTITAGQHTNGPATIWIRRDGGEWVNTGMHQMHKVRNAWALANEDGNPNPLYQFGEIR